MSARVSIFLASLIIAVSSVFAAQSVISGKATSSSASVPVVRAEVWWNGKFHSYTGINGEFTILGTTAGDVVRLHKKGFVDSSTIADFDSATIDFALAPVWNLENASQVYSDIAPYAWYEPAVRRLYENQTLTASGVQEFLPSQNLTRGELAVLGVKVAGFLPSAVKETHFCDVAPTDDFAPAVEFMFAHGWLSGYQSNDCKKGKVFRPQLPVNRAEAVKMVLTTFADLANQKVLEKVCLPAGFTDVPANAWFADFVNKANCLGFVNGYKDGSFHPAQPVNRAEIAVILANALESFF
ncbi:MAG: S-layer homology domain-containing protein [Patescibacteria group bacterium]